MTITGAFVLTVSLIALPLVAAEAQSTGQQTQSQAGAQSGQTPQTQVDVSSILGSQVRDAQGQNVGTIDRLMVNPDDGRITHAVIATGGFLGVGRDHVQVTWQDVKVGRDGQDVVVTMERRALEQAPAAQREDRTDRPAASPRMDRPLGGTEPSTQPPPTTPGAQTPPGTTTPPQQQR